MPFVVPFIPLIAAGLTAGVSLYEASQTPGTPKAPAPTPPQPQSAETNQAQKASVASSLPTLQSLTGGSLSPEYAAQFGATESGLNNTPQAAGNIQAAINEFFGLVAPGKTGLTPSSTTSGGGILEQLSKASIPGATPSFAGTTLSDEFRGFGVG